MDTDLDAIAHGRAFGIVGGRKNSLSECLEQPASDNGVDMYKYNTAYTFKLNWHVLAPESHSVKKCQPCMAGIYIITCSS